MEVEKEELQSLYEWVDELPLSRPKRNIARDFSDGVLAAEIVKSFYPRLVDLHNYSPASGLAQKLYNWSTLNTKVFRKLGFVVRHPECEAVASCEAGAIERVLKLLHSRLPELEPQTAALPSTSRSSSPMQSRAVQVDEAAAAEAHSGYADKLRESTSRWGEQAALLRMEEQECAIEDLRGANEVLEDQVAMLQADLQEREAHIESLTATLEAMEAKLAVQSKSAAAAAASKLRDCNVIRPARPLAERTPNSSTQVHAASRRMKPPPGLARLEF